MFDFKTNKKYYHEIKKEHNINKPRISLTFRKINTFESINGSNIIIGQGSPYKSFDDYVLDQMNYMILFMMKSIMNILIGLKIMEMDFIVNNNFYMC